MPQLTLEQLEAVIVAYMAQPPQDSWLQRVVSEAWLQCRQGYRGPVHELTPSDLAPRHPLQGTLPWLLRIGALNEAYTRYSLLRLGTWVFEESGRTGVLSISLTRPVAVNSIVDVKVGPSNSRMQGMAAVTFATEERVRTGEASPRTVNTGGCKLLIIATIVRDPPASPELMEYYTLAWSAGASRVIKAFCSAEGCAACMVRDRTGNYQFRVDAASKDYLSIMPHGAVSYMCHPSSYASLLVGFCRRLRECVESEAFRQALLACISVDECDPSPVTPELAGM